MKNGLFFSPSILHIRPQIEIYDEKRKKKKKKKRGGDGVGSGWGFTDLGQYYRANETVVLCFMD